MPRASLAFVIGLAACITLGAADQARAQQSVTIRAARRDTIVAATTVTAAFTVFNRRHDSLVVKPTVEAPKDWTVLMGGMELIIAPSSSEMLMTSVAVPVRTVAGVYVIRVRTPCPEHPEGVVDSVLVRVPVRRGIEVAVVDRPGFIVSGKTYGATVMVRNRGNQSSTIRISSKSSLGTVMRPDTVLELHADEARAVLVHVRTPDGLEAAIDDVLEIAAQSGDSASEASARITMVPEPDRKIEEYLKFPTRVNLRAASTKGVSPFEVFGRGFVRDDDKTEAEFLIRAPTGQYAAFGERDEYRLDLTAPNFRARLGDQFFMLSSLTGASQPGMGAGVDVTQGAFSFGGYGQYFRHSIVKGNEGAAYLTARPIENGALTLNLVNRTGGSDPTKIGSVEAAFGRGGFRGDAEVARSSAGSGGLAKSLRLSGTGEGYSIDAGHNSADTAFSGVFRGSSHDHVNAFARPFALLGLSLNAGSHQTDLSRTTGVSYKERLDMGTLAATIADRFTIELNGVQRRTTVVGVRMDGHQRGVRTRADQPTILGHLTAEAEVGRAREGSMDAKTYTRFSLGARRSLRRGSIGTWAERYSGGSVMQGAHGTFTAGGDASLRLDRLTSITLSGYATRQSMTTALWNSQLDALMTRTLRNGNTISLRSRLMSGGALTTAQQSVAYLEYGLPLRLPVSRLRTTGRVYGRVVDSETGKGVAGALVRLGPQVAITDRDGKVAFGGVRGGEHRLSMSQETSFANAVFVGDPTLMVDSMQTQPTTFQLAIARSARVEVDVRRFAIARTGVAGAADSLLEAGSVENATLVLTGERDTLYRTTAANGKALFTDVPPGAWTITVRGDAPAFHRFDPDRLELKLAPGETQALTFRLVPRRRDVQIIGPAQELTPQLADPKATSPASSVRTPRPLEKNMKEKQEWDDAKDRQSQ
jgi:hypothetical protein